ncbi:MAG: adenine phosphoribosyltransferase [Sciscionella sp.]
MSALRTSRSLAEALELVTEVPDFPEQGVLFRDLTTLLADPGAFAAVIDALAETVPPGTELVAGVEARGFAFAAAVAKVRGLGLLLIRKPGKLPSVAHRVDYELEYGRGSLELAAHTVRPAQHVSLVDDVLATGGTIGAAGTLIERAGGVVDAVSVVLELSALGGRAALPGTTITALRTY